MRFVRQQEVLITKNGKGKESILPRISASLAYSNNDRSKKIKKIMASAVITEAARERFMQRFFFFLFLLP